MSFCLLPNNFVFEEDFVHQCSSQESEDLWSHLFWMWEVKSCSTQNGYKAQYIYLICSIIITIRIYLIAEQLHKGLNSR
jgi:hypothetical protein